MVKVDLKDAYFAVPIHKDHRQYLYVTYRRHPDNGRVSRDSSGPGKSTGFPVGKPGVRSKPQEVCPRTHTEDGISGLHGRHLVSAVTVDDL